jgi:hypothetical protein
MSGISPKQVPIGEYEYVDVVFAVANQPVTVRYQRLVEDDPRKVRWLDVSQGGLADGTIATIYRVTDSNVPQTGPGYLVLRSTVAGYSTRLLLFTERI